MCVMEKNDIFFINECLAEFSGPMCISMMGFCFQEVRIPPAESLNILDFHFSDFGLPEDLTAQATVRMFLDLNLVQEFNIDYKVNDIVITAESISLD